ncbi:hypothetical protein CC86DRAFT_461683 [Ophiobolus disseminans]|uniref:Uncharacterized protein n=1 Tax=Ophiobolus disseminans TaxID=1469910 RepID=A0A6A7AJ27_9PLEO|nr:hypothetical protein CC86DRAFT_461683 [Ophiobolus disseminans]
MAKVFATARRRRHPPNIPSSSLPDYDLANKSQKLVHDSNVAPHIRNQQELPYVRLDEEYAQSVRWSKNPGDLALETYFNTTKPNLETDYNVKGLRPVLLQNDGFYRFILKDEQDHFYVWDEDSLLFWVKDEEIEKPMSLEDKVDFVLCGLGCLEVEPVYRNHHPTEDSANLKEIREKISSYRI